MVEILRYEDGPPIGKNGKKIFCLPGDKFENDKGERFVVTNYITALNVEILFDDGSKAITTVQQIKKRKSRNFGTTSVNGKQFTVKVGDRFTNSDGAVAVVIAYDGMQAVTVRFEETGFILKTQGKGLQNGEDFKDPYFPSKFGVGYCGTKYPMTGTREYTIWSSLLQRCYGSDYKVINQTYKDTFVEKYLHGYEEFYEFVNSKAGFHLGYEMDKDLLKRGNKLYCRESITFIPKIINVAIQGGKRNLKLDLPVGVFLRKDSGKYRAISGEYGKNVDCGQYDNCEEAFQAYRRSKETYLKKLANEYKDTIESKAYEALMNYEVLITD